MEVLQDAVRRNGCRTWFVLTMRAVLGRRFVEGEPQRYDCRQLQNDERDVLQRLPDELEERLGRLRRDHVRPEHVLAPRQVVRQARETCKRVRMM